jgi:hypothetical protein
MNNTATATNTGADNSFAMADAGAIGDNNSDNTATATNTRNGRTTELPQVRSATNPTIRRPQPTAAPTFNRGP